MRKFTLSTDSTCDLYHDFIKAHDIKLVCHTFFVEKDGKIEERVDNFRTEQEYKEFYRELREGAYARTSMLNYEAHYKHFLSLAREGAEDVVHVTISSGLSPTREVAARAAADVKREYPKFEVYVVDPLTATVGQGSLVMLGAVCRDKGMTAQETLAYLHEKRTHIQHFIVASDLNYLKRGGRVSAAAATFGNMLNIKPIITFDDEGKLIPLTKVKGTKKAISFIKRKLEKEGPDRSLDYVFVVHTGNDPAAEELAAFVEHKFGFKPFVSVMGPVIGAHVGPDAFALGYISVSGRNSF